MATDYFAQANKLGKKYEEEETAKGETQKAEVNTQLDQQIAKAESDMALQTEEIKKDYHDIIDANAVQKELDKRRIAETMANMGLSRSGLNATQQTAVELSAGNKNAAAMRQRQAAVDSLTRSLAEYKMQIEDKRRESINEIDAGVQSNIASYNADLYKDATEATSADYKAGLDAQVEMEKIKAEAAEKAAKNDAENARLWKNRYYSYRGTIDGMDHYRVYDPDLQSWKVVGEDVLINNLAKELSNNTNEDSFESAKETVKKWLYQVKHEYGNSANKFYGLNGRENTALSAELTQRLYLNAKNGQGQPSDFAVPERQAVIDSIAVAVRDGSMAFDWAAELLNGINATKEEINAVAAG